MCRTTGSLRQGCGGWIGSMPLDRHGQEHTGPQMESALRPVSLPPHNHSYYTLKYMFPYWFYLEIEQYTSKMSSFINYIWSIILKHSHRHTMSHKKGDFIFRAATHRYFQLLCLYLFKGQDTKPYVLDTRLCCIKHEVISESNICFSATLEKQTPSRSAYGTTKRSINDRGRASWAAYDCSLTPSAG